MIYDTENKYIRDYMRVRRGKAYMVGLEAEAEKRCYTIKELVDLLLTTIVNDNLFDAVLGKDEGD